MSNRVLTQDEKCRIIADTLSSRRGRIRLADAMMSPWAPGGEAVKKCQTCALLRSKDCEAIRPNGMNKECWCPEGRIVIWEEREEREE